MGTEKDRERSKSRERRDEEHERHRRAERRKERRSRWGAKWEGAWREKTGTIAYIDIHAIVVETEIRAGPSRAVLFAKEERGAENEGEFIFSVNWKLFSTPY